jgi:hypothetical protein
MKRIALFTIILTAMVATSCSSTKFTENRGEDVGEGKGGTVRVVNGIEFWENGEPNRKFKILGAVDDSRGEGWIPRSGRDGAIAKVAKEHGADAVVLVGESREFHGVNLDSGAANYRRITKVMLVKYIQ